MHLRVVARHFAVAFGVVTLALMCGGLRALSIAPMLYTYLFFPVLIIELAVVIFIIKKNHDVKWLFLFLIFELLFAQFVAFYDFAFIVQNKIPGNFAVALLAHAVTVIKGNSAPIIVVTIFCLFLWSSRKMNSAKRVQNAFCVLTPLVCFHPLIYDIPVFPFFYFLNSIGFTQFFYEIGYYQSYLLVMVVMTVLVGFLMDRKYLRPVALSLFMVIVLSIDSSHESASGKSYAENSKDAQYLTTVNRRLPNTAWKYVIEPGFGNLIKDLKSKVFQNDSQISSLFFWPEATFFFPKDNPEYLRNITNRLSSDLPGSHYLGILYMKDREGAKEAIATYGLFSGTEFVRPEYQKMYPVPFDENPYYFPFYFSSRIQNPLTVLPGTSAGFIQSKNMKVLVFLCNELFYMNRVLAEARKYKPDLIVLAANAPVEFKNSFRPQLIEVAAVVSGFAKIPTLSIFSSWGSVTHSSGKLVGEYASKDFINIIPFTQNASGQVQW